MKLNKVVFDTPSFYFLNDQSDKEAKREQAKANLIDIVSALPNCSFLTNGPGWNQVTFIMSSDSLSEFLGTLPAESNKDDTIRFVSCFPLFSTTAVEGQLQKMIDRLELSAARLSSFSDMPGFNQHTNSPVVGNHLLDISELMLCEDYCTDALQERLNEGWRIIAVCPQEARRPDYVLGMVGKERPDSARRG